MPRRVANGSAPRLGHPRELARATTSARIAAGMIRSAVWGDQHTYSGRWAAVRQGRCGPTAPIAPANRPEGVLGTLAPTWALRWAAAADGNASGHEGAAHSASRAGQQACDHASLRHGAHD